MSNIADSCHEIMNFRIFKLLTWCILINLLSLINQLNTYLVGFGLLKEGKKKINVL